MAQDTTMLAYHSDCPAVAGDEGMIAWTRNRREKDWRSVVGREVRTRPFSGC